jgi:hypothetical protein
MCCSEATERAAKAAFSLHVPVFHHAIPGETSCDPVRPPNPARLVQTLIAVAMLVLAIGCGGGSSSPKNPATTYYDQVRSLEGDLAHAARSRNVEKLQQVLADGETDLPKMQPPRWARRDHNRLSRQWAQLASDLADARDDPGGGFEGGVAADVRQINATTERLAAAVAAHRP